MPCPTALVLKTTSVPVLNLLPLFSIFIYITLRHTTVVEVKLSLSIFYLLQSPQTEPTTTSGSMLSLADLLYQHTVVAELDGEKFAHSVTLYPQSVSPSQSIFIESASSRTWQNTLCHKGWPGGAPHATVSSSHSRLQDRPSERLMLNTHLITILPEEWSRQGGEKKVCEKESNYFHVKKKTPSLLAISQSTS